MKQRHILFLLAIVGIIAGCSGSRHNAIEESFSLKETFGNDFLVGTALNSQHISGKDTAAIAVIKRHFNAAVAENCMKSQTIHPEEHRYDFAPADSFMRFCEANNMAVIGHCLIWHSQLAPWFCVDSTGRNVSPQVLKQRMKEHIFTIVGRYKGRVHGWDVVNEAILEDGSYRKSKFYEILGEDYIPYAFQCAHEADPEAELYYNDYGMNLAGRRDAVARLVRSLKEKDIRIDAVGMQGHMGIDYPTVEEFEKSMLTFASAGVKVMITEWDMSALPTVSNTANISDTAGYRESLNPYKEALPNSVSHLWNTRMKSFFDLFLKHSDIVTRVTAWGVSDGESWKNDFPIQGRRDYPLLFDRSYQPKPFVRELLSPKKAVFDSFVYSSDHTDEEAEKDCAVPTNPLLPGCYPDPSICRVGDDYYLVNSSFAFYPGIPIWHSTDLKIWKRLGYVLSSPSQLTLRDGLRISGGIYAPDIQYNPHNKMFYVITTDVNGGGNFFVTTDDPQKGKWSDPIFLPEVGGIDPSILFDEDGKAYIVNNDIPVGDPQYDGHRAIWVREFDWKNNCTKGEQRLIINGGVDIRQKPVWIEGPHLYHIGGRYYLMAAEGGTSTNHSEVIFSGDTPFGPFEPCPINPILTQRDLSDTRSNPVTCTGHADLVQTPDGDWFAVFLAVRPYRDGHDVMGRETFILPVEWKDDQPVILSAGATLTYHDRPIAPTLLWTTEGLSNEAFFIRTPQTVYYHIDRLGKLTLNARSTTLGEWRQPAAIGRWITANSFTAQTSLEFIPTSSDDFAGIILFQNDECNVRFGKSLDAEGKPCLKLEAYSLGKLQTEATIPLSDGEASKKVWLLVEGDGQVNYTFKYSFNPEADWTVAGEPVSADLLSTKTAGGFTGTMVGIYATGNYNDK